MAEKSETVGETGAEELAVPGDWIEGREEAIAAGSAEAAASELSRRFGSSKCESLSMIAEEMSRSKELDTSQVVFSTL